MIVHIQEERFFKKEAVGKSPMTEHLTAPCACWPHPSRGMRPSPPGSPGLHDPEYPDEGKGVPPPLGLPPSLLPGGAGWSHRPGSGTCGLA